MKYIVAQLQTLSLASNKLSEVPTEALRPLHQLITLHLNDNNITRCAQQLMSHVTINDSLRQKVRKYMNGKENTASIKYLASFKYHLSILCFRVYNILFYLDYKQKHFPNMANTYKIYGSKITSKIILYCLDRPQHE